MVAELYGLHGLAHQLCVNKQASSPRKHRVALQVEVSHQVWIGIDVVFATACILLLTSFHEVHHRSVVGELSING